MHRLGVSAATLALLLSDIHCRHDHYIYSWLIKLNGGKCDGSFKIKTNLFQISANSSHSAKVNDRPPFQRLLPSPEAPSALRPLHATTINPTKPTNLAQEALLKCTVASRLLCRCQGSNKAPQPLEPHLASTGRQEAAERRQHPW